MGLLECRGANFCITAMTTTLASTFNEKNLKKVDLGHKMMTFVTPPLEATSIEKIPKILASGQNFQDPLPLISPESIILKNHRTENASEK